MVQPLRSGDALPQLPRDVPGERLHLPAWVQRGVQQAGGGGMTARSRITAAELVQAATLAKAEGVTVTITAPNGRRTNVC